LRHRVQLVVFVAADLLSQAEHGPGGLAVVITWSEEFADHPEEFRQAHDAMLRCYTAGVTRLPCPAEHVEFPYRGSHLAGWLRSEWDRVLGVNLRGAFVGAKTARPFLREGSSVVMLSSICAVQGFGARGSRGIGNGLADLWLQSGDTGGETVDGGAELRGRRRGRGLNRGPAQHPADANHQRRGGRAGDRRDDPGRDRPGRRRINRRHRGSLRRQPERGLG